MAGLFLAGAPYLPTDSAEEAFPFCFPKKGGIHRGQSKFVEKTSEIAATHPHAQFRVAASRRVPLDRIFKIFCFSLTAAVRRSQMSVADTCLEQGEAMSARVSAASESNANPRLRGCGEDKHVYVILPAYNEQDRIAEVLCALKSHQCRVIVVDDGSTDATFEAAAVHGATVIRHAVNRGQGAALQTGFDFALSLGAKVLVTMDADGQHCAEDLRALVEPILSGKFQVALGSRFLDDRTTLPCSRRWLLKLAVQFTRWTTGLNLSDTHNGYRALAQCAAAELQLTEDRMAHATEILHLVRAKHWSYCEIPVRVVYDEETLAKGQRNWEVLRILWQLLASRLFPILQPSNDGRIDTGLSSSLQSSKAASPGRTTSGLANRPYSFN